MGYGLSILKISNGDITVDLLASVSGFHLIDWTPTVPTWKDNGVWQSSPFADGRQLVSTSFEDPIDTFDLVINGQMMDLVIRDTQNLRRLLMSAVSYWTISWQNTPVWIEARGERETNTRYAIIKNWRTPQDDNPFMPPFYKDGIVSIEEFTLIVEHGLWQSVPPGQSECAPIRNGDCICWPYYLEFNGSDTSINCGSDAGLDNLADNAFTAEAWIYRHGYGEGSQGKIFHKTGWLFGVYSGGGFNGLDGWVDCAVTNAASTGGASLLTVNAWHHVAMTWDDAADRKVFLFIDGVPLAAYDQQILANGAIVADAAANLYIGNDSIGALTFDGLIGWCRISNIVRYAAPFTPPPRCRLPDIDTNTLGQWIKEGTGTAIDNMQGTAARDGTLSGTYAWGCDCCED